MMTGPREHDGDKSSLPNTGTAIPGEAAPDHLPSGDEGLPVRVAQDCDGYEEKASDSLPTPSISLDHLVFTAPEDLTDDDPTDPGIEIPSRVPTPEQIKARRQSIARFSMDSRISGDEQQGTRRGLKGLGNEYIPEKIETDRFAAEGNEIMAQQIGIWLETMFRKWAWEHVLNDAQRNFINSDDYAGNSIARYFDHEHREMTIWDLQKNVRQHYPDGDEDTRMEQCPKDPVATHRSTTGRRMNAVQRETDLNFLRRKLKDAHDVFFENLPILDVLDVCTAVGAFSALTALPVYKKYGLLSGGPNDEGRIRIWINDIGPKILRQTLEGDFYVPEGAFFYKVFGSKENYELCKQYLIYHAIPLCCAIDDPNPFNQAVITQSKPSQPDEDPTSKFLKLTPSQQAAYAEVFAKGGFDGVSIGFGYHHLPRGFAQRMAARNLIANVREGGFKAVADEDQVYSHGMAEIHQDDATPLTEEWPLTLRQSKGLVPQEKERRPLPEIDNPRIRVLLEDFPPESQSHYNYLAVVKGPSSPRGLSAVMSDFFFNHDITMDEPE